MQSDTRMIFGGSPGLGLKVVFVLTAAALCFQQQPRETQGGKAVSVAVRQSSAGRAQWTSLFQLGSIARFLSCDPPDNPPHVTDVPTDCPPSVSYQCCIHESHSHWAAGKGLLMR